ncbi:MAG: hypothetical protein H0X66_04835 [Verrucomicrobia bacterium]|nr:hypothetical protein [Verrucomicrobiota bacterium]
MRVAAVSQKSRILPPTQTPILNQTSETTSRMPSTVPADMRIAREWLIAVRSEMGGNYQVSESETVLLLSGQGESNDKEWLSFCERNIKSIRTRLGIKTDNERKTLIMLFTEVDDYYFHISRFNSDGEHPLTSGLCIRMGKFDHVVMPYQDRVTTSQVLAHELTHACVSHLPLPCWLNENLAMTFERNVSRQGFQLDREIADRHYEHWRKTSIQRFWSGEAFHIPSETEMAYGLAEILGCILTERAGPQAFQQFIDHADYKDAGQNAALNYLGLSLDEVLQGFLGDGDWHPSPGQISEYYNRVR